MFCFCCIVDVDGIEIDTVGPDAELPNAVEISEAHQGSEYQASNMVMQKPGILAG